LQLIDKFRKVFIWVGNTDSISQYSLAGSHDLISKYYICSEVWVQAVALLQKLIDKQLEVLVDLLVRVLINDTLQGLGVLFCEVLVVVFRTFKEVSYIGASFSKRVSFQVAIKEVIKSKAL
jgi:hypothetical protein